MLFKQAVIFVAAGAIMASLPAGHCAKEQKSATKSKTKSSSAGSPILVNDEAEIRSQMAALAAAASNGEAERMSILWTADGAYIDADGAQTKGREAIKKRLNDGLTAGRKANLSLSLSAVKLLGTDAAWAEGTVIRQTSVGLEPSTRFVMVLEKQAGKWLIASATETAIANRSAADHLNVVSWLVGEWHAEGGGTKVKMIGDWTGNKSFINCKFVLEKPGAPVQVENQIIGWDPTKEKIVSWHFDSNGGFGYGTWSKRGGQWVVSAEGVEQSGSRTSAMNIISFSGPNKFTWQSVNREIDGVPVPDTVPLNVEKAQQVSIRTTDSKN